MADSFTAQLRLILQTHLGNLNTWGANFNEGVVELIEDAIAGRADIDVSVANVTLTLLNGVTDTSRPMFLRVTGSPGTARQVIVPSLQKIYVVSNRTSPAFDIEVKTAANDGITVSDGESVIVFVDQLNDVVLSPIQAGNVATLPTTPYKTLVFDISNRTAGDSTVTVEYINQGGFVICRMPAISTTISTNQFVLAPQTSVPLDLIPSGPLSAEFPICINEAGSPVQAYLQVPDANANWLIQKADFTLWTPASARVFAHALPFTMHQVGL